MTSQFDGYNFIVRLDRGEQLVEQLQRFIQAESISGGWVSGIGGVQWVELGYYHLDTQEYEWQRFDKTLEITSLQGTIVWSEGEPAPHLHGSFSDEGMVMYGGHVRELEVGGTCELFIHLKQGSERWNRQHDDDVGLKLLDLSEESS